MEPNAVFHYVSSSSGFNLKLADRLKKPSEHRRRPLRSRLELRVKLYANEVRMVYQLDDLHALRAFILSTKPQAYFD